ncbi:MULTISPECIES: hypothetical protein [unclassified Bradyrhizobium]|uniref:hypothetical protein n=1 Tax=unclassified Bradyrhizobium TaxID=2631580 RepID=UPI002916DA99|nr:MULTISPECIES: hypothetical protein [unclassified Bradyrhizobium]
MDIAAAAATAEKIVEEVAKVEPTLATMAGMFVPGAAPVVASVQPMVALAIPFVEQALKAIAEQRNGDALAAFAELIGHLTKGMSNSPVLSPTGVTIPAVGAEGG